MHAVLVHCMECFNSTHFKTSICLGGELVPVIGWQSFETKSRGESEGLFKDVHVCTWTLSLQKFPYDCCLSARYICISDLLLIILFPQAVIQTNIDPLISKMEFSSKLKWPESRITQLWPKWVNALNGLNGIKPFNNTRLKVCGVIKCHFLGTLVHIGALTSLSCHTTPLDTSSHWGTNRLLWVQVCWRRRKWWSSWGVSAVEWSHLCVVYSWPRAHLFGWACSFETAHW